MINASRIEMQEMIGQAETIGLSVPLGGGKRIPGQLGKICRKMEQAGVNILVQYSDHSNQLILVVDDLERGRKVSEAWTKK
jgi:hypothetical protein